MSLLPKFLNKSRKTEFFTIKRIIEATSTLKNIDPEVWTLLGDICMQNTENFLERISSTSMFTEAGDSKFVGVATRTDKCSHE